MKKKIILTLAAAIVVITAAVCIGSAFISPKDIIAALIGAGDEASQAIIVKIRIPRVLLAFFTGAVLSAGGTAVQSVLKNPLASPYTIGVSTGASFGVALVLICSISIPLLSNFTMAASGFVFGILAAAASIKTASVLDKRMEGATIVLTGMVLALFIDGALTMVAGLSHEKYEAILKWRNGSFNARGWEYTAIIIPVALIGIVMLMKYSKELDILTFGEEQAASVGVETKKTKWAVLIISAVLTGTAVAFSGVIGFVDLAAPHIARKIFTPKHKLLIPMSALIGGIFMTLADLISRTLFAPRELPVSAVTAIIGAPFFIYVFLRGRKKHA